MHSGKGQLDETYLDAGGRILCAPELIPAPGQYILAHADASDSPLAVPVFFSASAASGFRAAPALPAAWMPGTKLNLRGPLGRGFALPRAARRVALIAFDDSPSRLRGLIPLALKAGSAVTLICECAPDDLSEEVEIQPLESMHEIYAWADFAAIDVSRENLSELRSVLGGTAQSRGRIEAQVLVRTPMPCGALAECGICALTLKDGWTMACRDGPVYGLGELS
jgi:dihydroorotate dehydrogenase electron transfer subunit